MEKHIRNLQYNSVHELNDTFHCVSEVSKPRIGVKNYNFSFLPLLTPLLKTKCQMACLLLSPVVYNRILFSSEVSGENY